MSHTLLVETEVVISIWKTIWQCVPSYFFIPFMRLSRQVYWGGLPFPPSVDHNLSELSAMTFPSWVALHSMAHSFIELHKPHHHDKAVIHMNKVSGYNEIPAELFKSLKDDGFAFIIPANLEDPEVATGLEKVNSHPNSQEG